MAKSTKKPKVLSPEAQHVLRAKKAGIYPSKNLVDLRPKNAKDRKASRALAQAARQKVLDESQEELDYNASSSSHLRDKTPLKSQRVDEGTTITNQDGNLIRAMGIGGNKKQIGYREGSPQKFEFFKHKEVNSL